MVVTEKVGLVAEGKGVVKLLCTTEGTSIESLLNPGYSLVRPNVPLMRLYSLYRIREVVPESASVF